MPMPLYPYACPKCGGDLKIQYWYYSSSEVPIDKRTGEIGGVKHNMTMRDGPMELFCRWCEWSKIYQMRDADLKKEISGVDGGKILRLKYLFEKLLSRL